MFEQNKEQVLSSRQKQILALLRKGLSNNEICTNLGISENTVKVHLSKIYKLLNVSNRVEAINATSVQSINKESPKDLRIVFLKINDISNHPKAYSLFLSIVESIQQYCIFRIIDSSRENIEPGFLVEVSASNDKDEILFITTRVGTTNEILWTKSIKVNTDNIMHLAQKSAMQLFRNIVLASSKLKYSPDSPLPYWWFVTTRSIAELESRNQEAFEKNVKKLTPLISDDDCHEFILYVLAHAYYIAILENWGDLQQHSEKLGELARKAMSKAPSSIYTQMIMAFYNIIHGNKSEAITNLKLVIETNPQVISARTILIQIYLLTAQEDKALELSDECSRLIPETAQQASVNHARVLILLLLGKYEECINLAKQVLLFTPKALAVRLCLIFCEIILENETEKQINVKELFEYYPNLKIKDVEKLLIGVSPERKVFIMDRIKSIFN